MVLMIFDVDLANRNCTNERSTFIHSDYFYSASYSPLLLRGAPDTARTLKRQSATSKCECRTCPRSRLGGYSGSQTHDPSDERHQLYQSATKPHVIEDAVQRWSIHVVNCRVVTATV